ncbi:hypothetical protein SAMN02745126_03683 [Enhydrobacter aerosaccus]|uniref:Uncharacterized protein n=2 Tax=Enhydrobacter aerosaccus TaxID=225324 RepID=A0A1T4R9L7_9HYPH|nr:hypothetical protein SAMN02745126_03683 [Enhydrobacter aerosaccus]
MATIRADRRRTKAGVFVGTLLGAFLLAGAAFAQSGDGRQQGWKLEPNVEPPSYAVIEPVKTNLNIEALVLTCEQAGDRRVLQFQLYVSPPGPLLPAGSNPRELRADPSAQMQIDGRVYPISLFFAEDYVVLADAVADRVPLVSDRLLDGVQDGKTMILRFDLVAKDRGGHRSFDGEATIDLKAAPGGSAVAAVRHCVDPVAKPSARSAWPPHPSGNVSG